MKTQNVYGKLWIGPGDEIYRLINDQELKIAKGCIGVLNVADDYPEKAHHRDITVIHAGLNDGPEDWSKEWGAHNSVAAYRNAITALDYFMISKAVVYIHCHGGVSRSTFVTAMYLMSIFKQPFKVVMKWLNAHYSRCNIHPKHHEMIADIHYCFDKNFELRSKGYWDREGIHKL